VTEAHKINMPSNIVRLCTTKVTTPTTTAISWFVDVVIEMRSCAGPAVASSVRRFRRPKWLGGLCAGPRPGDGNANFALRWPRMMRATQDGTPDRYENPGANEVARKIPHRMINLDKVPDCGEL
jgi:hypothetical protein